MTARNDFDRSLSAWLHDDAVAREPEHLLGQVLARTARTRRRAAWRIPERWFSMSAISSRFAPASQVPWRFLAVAALLLLALAVGLVLAASGAFQSKAAPFGPAGNGQIFYSTNGDLVARSVDGTTRQIVTGATEDGAPVVSPDGTKLSFLRSVTGGHELWVMNADGSNQHRLDLPGRDIGWFDWSPRADAAVVLMDSARSVLTIVPSDGSALASHDIGVYIDQPVFRPAAGSQVAFLGVDNNEHGIYLVNRDGTGLVRLALDPGFASDEFYETNRDFYFWTMSWSPTGDRLLYTQLEPAPGSTAGPGFRNHLATIGANGEVISDEILEFDAASDDESFGIWAPSGDAMVFQNIEGSRHWLSYATLGSSGAGPARALGVEAVDFIGTQISPDGTKLLAVMPALGNAAPVVYLLDIASGTKSVLSVGEDASWQRLGR